MGKTTKSFSLDEDVAEQIDHRPDLNASAVANKFFREYLAAGRAPDAALAMRLERIEQELENARSEHARLESTIERLEREREDVKRQMETRRDGLQRELAVMADKVRSGDFPRRNLTPENPAVQNRAGKANVTPQRFVDELLAELGDGR